jgi:glutathione peroxidase
MSIHVNQALSKLILSLALLSLMACETEEEPQAAGTEAAAGGEEPTAGTEEPTAGAEEPTAGAEEPTAGAEEPTAGAEEPTAGAEEPTGGSPAEGGEEIIIDIAGAMAGGMEEEYPPIDESIPGEGVHAFTMRSIIGEDIDMRRYRGKVVLAVNVASACGYTSQYAGLQALYEQYRERGLVILGFPANNFGGQEPGSDEEIAEFCSANYGVTFPMFAKISVAGADIHPLYEYLTGESGRAVSWNFNKFLVDVDGHYSAHYLSGTTPQSAELISAIEALLPPQD